MEIEEYLLGEIEWRENYIKRQQIEIERFKRMLEELENKE